MAQRINILLSLSALFWLVAGCALITSVDDSEDSLSQFESQSPFLAEFDVEELTTENVHCVQCRTINECRFTCLNSCARSGMAFFMVSPYSKEAIQDGTCPCMCGAMRDDSDMLISKAILTGNASHCLSIGERQSLNSRDYCLIVLAMLSEDVDTCNAVAKRVGANSRDACYAMLALATDDAELCSNISVVDAENDSQTHCQELLAEYPKVQPLVAKPK